MLREMVQSDVHVTAAAVLFYPDLIPTRMCWRCDRISLPPSSSPPLHRNRRTRRRCWRRNLIVIISLGEFPLLPHGSALAWMTGTLVQSLRFRSASASGG